MTTSIHMELGQYLAEKYQLDRWELEQAISQFLADNYAVHAFGVSDVLTMAEQYGYPMNREQAGEVLRIVEGGVDSDYGMTYESVRVGLETWYDQIDLASNLETAKTLSGAYVVAEQDDGTYEVSWCSDGLVELQAAIEQAGQVVSRKGGEAMIFCGSPGEVAAISVGDKIDEDGQDGAVRHILTAGADLNSPEPVFW